MVAQPFLYHEVRPLSPPRLLRTLLARPDLAAAVRGMFVPYGGCWDAPEGEDEVAAVEEARARAGVVFPENWLERWYGHQLAMPSRVIGLLLGLMTGLEALTYIVEDSWLDDEEGGETENSESLGWPSLPPTLRHLNLEYEEPERAFTLGKSRETRDLINAAAPHLQSLRLETCWGYDHYHSPVMCLDGIKSLICSSCSIPGAELASLIVACPVLERFAYSAGDTSVIESISDQEFLPAAIWAALRTRRATLRHLDLGFEEGFAGECLYFQEKQEEGGFRSNERFGSFDDFYALETFIVMTELFRSDDDGGAALDPDTFHNSEAVLKFLPKNVRVLGLETPPGCGYAGGVVLVDAVARGQFPNLETVALGAPDDEWDRVVAEFAAVGVKCEYYDGGWSTEVRKGWQAQWPGYF